MALKGRGTFSSNFFGNTLEILKTTCLARAKYPFRVQSEEDEEGPAAETPCRVSKSLLSFFQVLHRTNWRHKQTHTAFVEQQERQNIGGVAPSAAVLLVPTHRQAVCASKSSSFLVET